MPLSTQKIIQNVTRDFNLSYEHFLHQSTKLFLEKKLREIRIRIYEIGSKYGVSSIDAFENLYKEDKLDELESFGDYKELDRLEYQKEKIEKFLSELLK